MAAVTLTRSEDRSSTIGACHKLGSDLAGRRTDQPIGATRQICRVDARVKNYFLA